MLPDLTFVEWAIVGSMVVSSVTLLIVGADFYQSHLKTKQSDVSVRASNSRDSYSNTRSKSRFSSVVTLANEGDRSAVIRAKQADIEFNPSGQTYSWEELQAIEAPNGPYVSIQNVEDNSLPPHSAVLNRC
ncbi:hypothetical protein EXE44_15830 [Halorubrum sp. SS7]|uniref:hypothetical protein n=1 Tax=unclassified Halorubrum TaxID=2642239 RepID=UPI0010F45DD3|nr:MULTISPECIES: hypothetical protein [unclassified Halorubrum]TKX53026.1 hypothetical protein EXE42_14465 [Halorubrum sp. SP3]TKX55973.1 hypothetical protein EXE44_15830 [Halorubrum sp. SS7]